MDKCLSGMATLITLEYALSADDRTDSKDKIRATQQLPEPTTIKEYVEASFGFDILSMPISS